MARRERQTRKYDKNPKTGDRDLGPLALLPGTWKANGTGWNMIALPFDGGPFKYRVLMNQYNEELVFSAVDDNVPNRGLSGIIPSGNESDQFVVTLDYQQSINQIAAEDSPNSGLAGPAGLAIHHEPGLWLHMKNLRTSDTDAVIDVARLASIPHGNSLLALGFSEEVRGLAVFRTFPACLLVRWAM